jgi:rfaE bifunctional protein kinase chain/domain
MESGDNKSVFEAFRNLKVLIVGDVMVDSYLWGKVERISPEAPVPVVAVKSRSNRLGGAANVALNIQALGAIPLLCSVIGDDVKGNEFIELLKNEKLSTEGIIQSSDRITTTKHRVIGNKTQLLRVDEEKTDELILEDERNLRERVFTILEKDDIDVIIFQDYDKGVITKHLIKKIVERANHLSIPVAVDPKKKHFVDYRNIALFKPNIKELREGLNMEISLDNAWEIENAANVIHREQEVKMVFTTLSEGGVFFSSLEPGMEIQRAIIPAHVRNIADVSGAGDTVISVAALCLASGMAPKDIAAIANLAGGIVCEEVGVVPVKLEKLDKEAKNL